MSWMKMGFFFVAGAIIAVIGGLFWDANCWRGYSVTLLVVALACFMCAALERER